MGGVSGMGGSGAGRVSQRVGAALVALALLLGGAPGGTLSVDPAVAGPVPVASCDAPATPISEIQGSGVATQRSGEHVVVRGVVTADFRARGGLGGFFVQDPVGDGDPATSDALFVFVPASAPTLPPDFGPEQLVTFSGTVSEFHDLTEITGPSGLVVCGPASVAPTELGLLDVDQGDLERFENMLVTVPDELTVTETFQQGRYGSVSLSFDGRRWAPTTLYPPGSEEAAALDRENGRRRLILDDASPAEDPRPIPYLGAEDTVRVGDTVHGLTGVLAYERESTRSDGRDFRLEPTIPPAFVRANPRTAAPVPVGGTLKVATFNVLNYFNGDGRGGGFPGERGARTRTEFDRQRRKIVAALTAIDADVVGLMEIERDEPDQYSAVADLVAGLNEVLGAGTYEYVREPAPGDDAINHQVDDADGTPLFERPPLAQTFRVNASGELLTVVVNHFKSKNPPADPADPNAAS